MKKVTTLLFLTIISTAVLAETCVTYSNGVTMCW
jgi:hypothetical protein